MGTFQRGRSLVAENKFLQAVKGAENTKEKSRQCFMCRI
jgi:predicted adenine nucleotide alpha hydrolase (AANH) superfamily ATPase